MSKAATTVKAGKPEQVEIWIRNMDEYYALLEQYILDGYTVITDGYLSPTNIAGILSTHLKLKQ